MKIRSTKHRLEADVRLIPPHFFIPKYFIGRFIIASILAATDTIGSLKMANSAICSREHAVNA
jgi:hypothetical protein